MPGTSAVTSRAGRSCCCIIAARRRAPSGSTRSRTNASPTTPWPFSPRRAARRPTPDCYHNVVANPDVTVELGTETFPARARIAEGAERDAIWEQQKRDWPGFADYEDKTKGIREIPVVVLDKTLAR
jgi:hypothetical protein